MNHHDEYDLAQLPDYARYIDKPVVSRDFDKGCILTLLLSIPFWGAVIGIVTLAKACTGGG